MDKLRIKTLLNERFVSEEEENPNFANQEDQGEKGPGFSGLYKRVQRRLENDLFNHAAVMRRLNWDGDDNTNRSLFEKKLKRAKNDNGGVYEFTEEELKKILTILDAGTQEK